MNYDDFELKLRELTTSSQRPDPTAAWKADILARARREAGAAPLRRTLPPRWLMLTWATAWAAILALHLTLPSDTSPQSAEFATTTKAQPLPDDSMKPMVTGLVAFHQQLNLNLDQP